MNTRRKFLIGLAALYANLAHAQPAKPGAKPVRVGILSTVVSAGPQIGVKLFVATLGELGWVEGRNIVYDRVYAEGDEKRLPALAAELVARRPDLIYVMTNAETFAAAAATRTIPVVCSGMNDPVEFGIVKSLARPGGNVTGVVTLGPETGSKRMQLLKEAVPKIGRVGVLMKPGLVSQTRELKLIEQAAGAGVKVFPAMANAPEELDAAFAFLAKNRVEGLVVAQVAFFIRERKRILGFAAKQRIPVVAQRPQLADDGALMSYNAIFAEQVRRAAHLADKVLRGTKPADIPVEQPTRFELVVNMKTGKALGITIPQSVLVQATRVIE